MSPTMWGKLGAQGCAKTEGGAGRIQINEQDNVRVINAMNKGWLTTLG